MNKNDLIKWALIAGAAYLVYRYLQSAGYLGAPATGVDQPDTLAAPAEKKTSATPTQTSAPPAVTAATIATALTAVPGFSYWGVNGEGGNTQSGHHWNYYWKLSSLYNGHDAGPGELGVADDYQMSLSDYSSRLYKLFFSGDGVAGLWWEPERGFDPDLMSRLASAWTM